MTKPTDAPEDAGDAAEGPIHDADITLPEAVRPLAWLIGRWSGFGKGQYPTIEDFTFVQEVEFRCDGRPFLSYSSRSWMIDEDGNRIRPTGTETGFWRPQPGNLVEVVLSHPTGYAEIWHGSLTVAAIENARITKARIELQTDVVARTQGAKDYSQGERLYGLVDGRLLWTFDMAAVGQPMQNHLAATLNPELTDATEGAST